MKTSIPRPPTPLAGTAKPVLILLVIGFAVLSVACARAPAHAQECGGTGGCSIRDVVESGSISTTAGASGTAMDPTWTLGKCTINGANPCTPSDYVGLE